MKKSPNIFDRRVSPPQLKELAVFDRSAFRAREAAAKLRGKVGGGGGGGRGKEEEEDRPEKGISEMKSSAPPSPVEEGRLGYKRDALIGGKGGGGGVIPQETFLSPLSLNGRNK